MRKLLIALLAPCMLSSCSLFTTSPPPPPHTLETLSLYLSRTSLLQTDYEQYKVSVPYLVMECGVIRRGKHVAAKQETIELDEDLQLRLSAPLWELLALLQGSGHRYPEPGKNSGMADPGQLFIEIVSDAGATAIRTSLDAVSAPRSPYERKLLEAVRHVRGLPAGPPCGMKDFYGIGLEELH